MKAKQVCKLQENLAKEAIAYLVLYGTTVDVAPYRKAVTQVGTVWGLPIPDTQRWLDLIRQEEIAVTQAAEPEKVNHVMEEKDLPINASGLQTLDNIWGLFETAVELNSVAGRREMYALARELSECQNLTTGSSKSQTENGGGPGRPWPAHRTEQADSRCSIEKPCGSTALFVAWSAFPRRCPLCGPVSPFPRGGGIRTPAALLGACGGFVRAVPKMSGDRPALMASHFRL